METLTSLSELMSKCVIKALEIVGGRSMNIADEVMAMQPTNDARLRQLRDSVTAKRKAEFYEGAVMSEARPKKAPKDQIRLGKELMARRLELGYSMRYTAKTIGTNHQLLGRVERGLSIFDYYTATAHTNLLQLDDRKVMFEVVK